MDRDIQVVIKSRMKWFRFLVVGSTLFGFFALLVPSLYNADLAKGQDGYTSFSSLLNLRTEKTYRVLSVAILISSVLTLCMLWLFIEFIEKPKKASPWLTLWVKSIFSSTLRMFGFYAVTMTALICLISALGQWIATHFDSISKMGPEGKWAHPQYASYFSDLADIVWFFPLASVPVTVYVFRLANDVTQNQRQNKPIETLISSLNELARQRNDIAGTILDRFKDAQVAEVAQRIRDDSAFKNRLEHREKQHKTAVQHDTSRKERRTAMIATFATVLTAISPLKDIRPTAFPEKNQTQQVEALKGTFKALNGPLPRSVSANQFAPVKMASLQGGKPLSSVVMDATAPDPCDFQIMLAVRTDMTDRDLSGLIQACQLMAVQKLLATPAERGTPALDLTLDLEPLEDLRARVALYQKQIDDLTAQIEATRDLPVRLVLKNTANETPDVDDIATYLGLTQPIQLTTKLKLDQTPFTGREDIRDLLNFPGTRPDGQTPAPLELPAKVKISGLAPDGLPLRVDVLANVVRPTGLRAALEAELETPFDVQLALRPGVVEGTSLPANCVLQGPKIFFNTNSDDPDSAPHLDANTTALRTIAQTITDQNHDSVYLVGFADFQGTVLHNLNLAERRARRTETKLRSMLGADASQLQVTSFAGAGVYSDIANTPVSVSQDDPARRQVSIFLCG